MPRLSFSWRHSQPAKSNSAAAVRSKQLLHPDGREFFLTSRFGSWQANDAEKVWFPERITAMQNVLLPVESYWERARLIIKTLSVCAAPGSGSGLPVTGRCDALVHMIVLSLCRRKTKVRRNTPVKTGTRTRVEEKRMNWESTCPHCPVSGISSTQAKADF